MKKIYVICIASALMLTGCSDKSDKKSESSFDVSAAVVTEVSTEGFESGPEDKKALESLLRTYKKEYSAKTTTNAAEFKEKSKLVTTILVENKKYGNVSLDDEALKSQAEVTAAAQESSKIHTTTAITDVTKDDAIELPFVPME